jgi:Subtilase family/Secretion system C-terminal sorting domain
MKKNHLIALFIALFYALNLTAQEAENAQAIDHKAGEILFQLVENQPVELVQVAWANIYGDLFEVREIAPTLHIYSLIFDPLKTPENHLLAQIKRDPSVSAAQFNHTVELRGSPNDPQFKDQWGLQKVNAPSVWDITTGGTTACGDTIVVAIIDGGFQPNISDLKDNIWVNKGEIPNNGIDDDKNGYVDDYQGLNTFTNKDNHTVNTNITHGIACAGIIGATGNNNKLITGVNWKIKLMLFSGILQSGETGIIKAYDYVLKQRRLYDSTGGKKGAFIPVTSMSAGFEGRKASDFPLLCAIYEQLNKQAILNFVAATDKSENVETAGDVPTLCNKEGLIIVTSTDNADGHLYGFSNKYVHLSAPGKDILILTPTEQTDIDDGTSFSTPLVAGAAALLWSLPEIGLCQLSKTKPLDAMNLVKNAILNGTDKLANLTAKTITGGRLNIKQSFNLLRRSFGQPIGDFDILQLFPNPVASQLNVQFQLPANSNPDVLIINALGQIVYQKKIEVKDISAPLFTINTADFAGGLYSLSLRTTGFEVSKKFVVVKK